MVINKLRIIAAILLLSYGVVGYGKPTITLKNGAGTKVYFYEIPQDADDNAAEQFLKELKDLPKQGVEQLLLDEVSPDLLAKLNSGLASLCAKQAGNEFGVAINYLDVRATENIAPLIRKVGSANALGYIAGTLDLETVYQQLGFTQEQAKKLSEQYQKKLAPWCQQIRQLIANISKTSNQQDADQLESLCNKFEQCFNDHLFIIFGLTRKALTAEHNRVLKEIASYKDGQILEAEYKRISEQFKRSAPWLTDTSAEETLANYARHCDFLSDDEKKEFEELKRQNPTVPLAIEDINFIKIIAEGCPLIAIRGVHAIVNSQKPVALFILESSVQELIISLLKKAGYAEVKP